MSAKLSKSERETHISWDEEGKTATVSTYSKKLISKLEKKLKLKATEEDDAGGKSFALPSKKMVIIRAQRPKRKLTAEQKAEVSERFAAARAARAKVAGKTAKKGAKPAAKPIVEDEPEAVPVKKSGLKGNAKGAAPAATKAEAKAKPQAAPVDDEDEDVEIIGPGIAKKK